MRSGTVPHTLAVGIGAACEIAAQEMEVGVACIKRGCGSIYSLQYDHEHVSRLSKKLIDGITSELDHVIRNGDLEQSYEGTCVCSDIKQCVNQLCLFLRMCESIFCLCGRRESVNGNEEYCIVIWKVITSGLYSTHYIWSCVLSACTSASLEPSYVLRAIGADEDLAHSSIRLA